MMSRRGGSWFRTHKVTAGLLGLLVLAVVNAARSGNPPAQRLTLAAPAGAVAATACPLSAAQERKAVAAFDKMLPVLFHPRCLNCHGAVNPYVDPQVGHHLGGQMTDSATGAALGKEACEDCHSELPGWDVPGDAMFFVGKSAKELCMQFKQFAPSGGAEFVEHIEHEPGLPPFIKTAFLGNRALNTTGEATYEDVMGQPPTPEKPPGDLPQLVALAQVWVNAMGAGWNADPECGCMVNGGWHGTIKAHGTAGSPRLEVSSQATVVFEIDPSWNTLGDPRSQYYKTTGGVATWRVQAIDGCRGIQQGMVPLDVNDVDGRPMGELRLDDNRDGSYAYLVTNGSWPDRWSPLFNVRCGSGTEMVELPTTNLLPAWWQHDLDNLPVTRNPDRLQGSYRWISGGIDIVWTWDLKRQR